MSVLAVIPARYASTRLPGKPLVPLGGKPMIERVWDRVRQATSVSGVLVATDDERIRSAVEAFGGEAVMTRSDHRSGTERIAEVAAARKDADIFVNVQGDEPLIEPAAIDEAVEAIQSDAEVNVATLAVPITNPADIMDPNVVQSGAGFRRQRALFFPRADSLGARPGRPGSRAASEAPGAYAFRREALLDFATFPQGDLERVEQLEQLRWLENGYRIRVAETEHDSVSVDVPEDVARVEALLSEH